jgi:hypothetical protein
MPKKIILAERVEYDVTITITEAESRALAKVLEWGADTIADAVLVPVSNSEGQPHRMTLVRLFEALRSELPTVNHYGDDARAVFQRTKIAHQKPDDHHEWRLVKKDQPA